MIEVKDLCYTEPVSNRSLLESLDFSIEPGELLSVLGANGAGKTTLLRSLFALLEYRGVCLLAGKDLRSYSRKELALQIAYIPQLGSRLPEMLVRDFVFLARKPRFKSLFDSYSSHQVVVERSLQETSSLTFIDRLVSSLSGGELQRVLLAAALAQETPVIIMDEPATFLDIEHEADLYKILESLRKDHNKAIVIASHNCNRSALASSRILALREGKQVFYGNPNEFMSQSVLDSVYGSGSLLISHPQANCKMILPQVCDE